MAREVAFQFPANDGYTGGAINWLLDAAADDAEFNADVARVVEARRKFPWIGTYRATLNAWAQARVQNKDLGKRAEAANVALAASDKEPVNADWMAFETVAAMRSEGLDTLLVCSLSQEESALVDRADVVVPGPEGVLELLRALMA